MSIASGNCLVSVGKMEISQTVGKDDDVNINVWFVFKVHCCKFAYD